MNFNGRGEATQPMNTQQVDPRTVSVWRWQALIVAAIGLVPVAIVATKLSSAASIAALLFYVALTIWFAWLYPSAYYRALSFGIDVQGVTIERGLWWRSRLALPRIRVQHSDVSQGPLQRRYGVATLKLYTAGSRYNKVELPGLTHEDAVSIREALIARGGDSGV